jgi:hypothetical protein
MNPNQSGPTISKPHSEDEAKGETPNGRTLLKLDTSEFQVH